MEKTKAISQKRLMEVLSYSPETGVFHWKINKGRVFKGTLCNTRSHGYIVIGIDRVRHKAHRLAWLYVYGVLPEKHLDHINRDKSDNRIKNLRECNDQQNGENTFSPKGTNKDGKIGVSFEAGKWRAKIWKARKQIHLGRFATKDEAAAAYMTAKKMLHEFASF